MGFRKPDLGSAEHAIRACIVEIQSPYNDGWTASACKHDLYLLKSWLDDEYKRLPTFVGESEWEQQRLIKILKKD
jgi:hypothetical protein